MKYLETFRTLFLLTLSFIVVGCSGATPISLENDTATELNQEDAHLSDQHVTNSVSDTLKTILQYVNQYPMLNNLRASFSPDGRWFLKNISTGNQYSRFEGFSLVNPEVGFRGLPDEKESGYLSLRTSQAWAPDGSAFLAFGADEGRAGCPFNRIVIYHLSEEDRDSRNFTFEPEPGGTCLDAVWSPDSQSVAVIIQEDPNIIYIIDKQGKLQRKVELYWDNGEPRSLLLNSWLDSGLVVKAIYENEQNNLPSRELRLIDVSDNLNSPSIIFEGSGVYAGAETKGARILVAEISDHTPTNLHIYNLETHEIEKELSMPWSGTGWLQGSSPYIAFQARSSDESQKKELWLFDWQTSELRNYGTLIDLITWLPQNNGFLILQGDEASGYYFEIVQP